MRVEDDLMSTPLLDAVTSPGSSADQGAAGVAAPDLSAVAGPLPIVAGMAALSRAAQAMQEGDTAEAARTGLAGATSLVGGGATTATAVMGAEAAGAVVAHTGPVAAALGTGLMIGHGMDEATRASGRYPHTLAGRGFDAPNEERAMSASEYGADQGVQAAAVLQDTGLPDWAVDGIAGAYAMEAGVGASIAGTIDAFRGLFD
jgi:hypothetical protein